MLFLDYIFVSLQTILVRCFVNKYNSIGFETRFNNFMCDTVMQARISLADFNQMYFSISPSV